MLFTQKLSNLSGLEKKLDQTSLNKQKINFTQK